MGRQAGEDMIHDIRHHIIIVIATILHRPRATWLDNVKTWTGCLSLEEALRATEDRTVWWKIVHDSANLRKVKRQDKTGNMLSD